MNELLLTMSADMGIKRFSGETEDSFTYRVLYSALGQWCLQTALNSSEGIIGTTKHNQTIVLNDLINKFIEAFPTASCKLIDESGQQTNLSVLIRRVYEETGYLITNESNRNRVANYGRSIPFGNNALFFGIPNADYTVNGLGVYSTPTTYTVSSKEFLMRDDLTYEKYFISCFDPIDFYRGIDQDDLEFFNPLSSNVPSRSWSKEPVTDCTVARKTETGPFYRVMRISGLLQFTDEPVEQQSDSFTSYDYRRLYFALKAHYENPLKATITKMDDTYSSLKIGGRLPNREFYYLLLLGWPANNAFDKVNFLIHNDLLAESVAILENIGIAIIEGGSNNE